jgi:hypothetical protein
MFQIIYNSRETDGHRDITIIIPDINLNSQVDSYYLCLDQLFMPDHEAPDKVEKCLKLMISSWVAAIEKAEVSQTIHLPYDFSDQYIGVLRVKINSDNEVSLSSGHTTKYCGYEISPSTHTTLDLNVNEFADDGHEAIVAKEILIARLNNALLVL